MAKKKAAKAKKSPPKHKRSLPKDPKKLHLNGKNNKGQFAKGNTAGSGKRSPEAKRKTEQADIFKNAVSDDDIRAIAQILVTKAKQGDTRAAQQVLDRCLGKVKEQVSLSLSGDTQDFLDYMGENYGGLPG